MGPVHRQNMASQIGNNKSSDDLTVSLAEFRGPGVRHQFDSEGPDDYDLDIHRYRGRNGRIILLGDGSEVLTDSTDDPDMFDHSMDDQSDEEVKSKQGSTTTDESDTQRSAREGTPGKDEQKKSTGSEMQVKGVQDSP